MWAQRDYAPSSVAGRPDELGQVREQRSHGFIASGREADSNLRTPDWACRQREVPDDFLVRPGQWIPTRLTLPNPYAGPLLLAAGWLTLWSSCPATGPDRRSCVRP